MFRGFQKIISEESGLSQPFINMWVNNHRQINRFRTAKRLANAFPGTVPEDWIERRFGQIEKAVRKIERVRNKAA